MGSEKPWAARRHRPSWPMYKHVERQAHLFGEMMERVGVDPGAAAREGQGRAYAAASRRCLLCLHTEACEQWLHEGGGQTPPGFCPNRAFLQRAQGTAGDDLVRS